MYHWRLSLVATCKHSTQPKRDPRACQEARTFAARFSRMNDSPTDVCSLAMQSSSAVSSKSSQSGVASSVQFSPTLSGKADAEAALHHGAARTAEELRRKEVLRRCLQTDKRRASQSPRRPDSSTEASLQSSPPVSAFCKSALRAMC